MNYHKMSTREKAEDLLSKMTLKEKIGQLNQRLYGFNVYHRREDEIIISEELKKEVEEYSGLGVLYGLYRADPWSGRDEGTGLSNELAPKAYNKIQNYVIEHSRLSIPMMLSTECPHGHQALGGYLLPVNLANGATFNPVLLQEAYKVCGRQLKELGVDLALVSVLDVLRDPRWGRSEECFSEDPYLSKIMASAVVKGIQDTGVYAVAKHFCAQGEGTGGVNASAARIGERELREIHLPPAQRCCEAGVKGIMAAYNEIDGVFCHANKKLLTDILRNEFGFQGIVMADGIAIDQLDVMTGDRVRSGALALIAGVDVSLWDTGFSRLDEAIERGYITEEAIDQAALRVLIMKYERGLFDNPYIPETNGYLSYHYDNFQQALNLARESVILLKNQDHILPLNHKEIKTIGVIGPNADELYHQLGDYTPPVNEKDGVTILSGIKQWLKDHSSPATVHYRKGCDILKGTKKEIEEAVKLAGSVDLVILALGGSSSRYHGADFDRNGAAKTGGDTQMDCGEGMDSSDINLPLIQRQLAEAIFQTGRKVITVVNQGRPYVITEIAKKTNGLIASFYGGMKAGQGIAEVLFGEISPSGHLPVSIPRSSGQIPAYYNYKSSYKGMDYYDVKEGALYPFGYGLSYSKFTYSDIDLGINGRSCEINQDSSQREYYPIDMEELKENGLEIQLSVENTGNYDAHTVLFLYIRDVEASTIRRVRELKDFQKLWIPKGETVSSKLILDEEKLSLWNREMEFVMELGEFELWLNDGVQDLWNGTVLIS